MPTAVINQSDVRVHLTGERLQVYGHNPESERDEVLREIPLRDLDRLIISESVHLTTPALGAILRAAIPIQVFSWSGSYLGGFLPAQNNHGLSRLQQYRRTLEPDFVLTMAGRIVTAKLYNQRRVLQRLAAGHAEPDPPGDTASSPAVQSESTTHPQSPTVPTDPAQIQNPKSEIQAALQWLDSLFASIRASKSIDELRGYEGAATARYFQTWAGFLPSEFPFERRSTRPPLNPVNACISFGSTLIYNEAVAFIHAHGLDPALGMLHATEDGRWSLALDLMEPFRPVLVEALALDLFSHQVLNAQHFEPRKGGVYLNEQGRKKFFLQYERRLERQFLSECIGHRTTLRQQLENQAVMFKSALEDPGKFEPFLIN
ncbi:MAG: CRISPR-associated endonuclease Cas1 [Candidatus Omnitrophica bacterium]|nr:CRISPR-associated endonuclease Cas1 [Candidatus Omnitrophota bacterium]